MKWVPETTAYDETFDRSAAARPHYRPLVATLESFTQTEIDRRERLGITFTVYGEKEGIERIFPFDFVPRITTARRRPAGPRATPGCRSRTSSSNSSSNAQRGGGGGGGAAGTHTHCHGCVTPSPYSTYLPFG